MLGSVKCRLSEVRMAVFERLELFHSELWRCFTPKIGAVLLRTLAVLSHVWLEKLKRGQEAFGGALPALASCIAMTLWPVDYLR